MANDFAGYFAGRATIRRNGSLGGRRGVFVKLQGAKNELVFPTFGGQVMNPFRGAAKLFAGDLVEYRTDADGVKPKLYILKTYEVVSASSTTLNIKRDGYKHIPFVGDVLMKAPATLGGSGVGATVTAVAKTKVGDQDVWALTMSAALTVAAGDVMVEAVANPDTTGATDTHLMLVANPNAVCPCDYDFRFDEVADVSAAETDWDGADYSFTPALGALMYTKKMSPMPPAVLALNTSKVNGWFKLGSWGNF